MINLDDLYVRPGHRDAGVGQAPDGRPGRAGRARRQLVIRWGMEVDNLDAQRFYARLGATLRPKVLAGWSPAAYTHLATQP